MLGPVKVVLRRDSIQSRAHVDLTGPGGESVGYVFSLPWLEAVEWQAVFLSLELHEGDPNTWPKDEIRQKAQELGLFLGDQNRPSRDRFKTIGNKLYNSVFGSEEIRRLLDRFLKSESEMVVFEFHFQDEGSLLQSYPWELLHDGDGFLFDGIRTCPTRHIDFDEGIRPLRLTGLLRVLYIAPRPNMLLGDDYDSLPLLEESHLEYLRRFYPDHFVLESLPDKSLDALQRRLIRSENPVHILHIDTHGDFGWLCSCKKLNLSGSTLCSRCGNSKNVDRREQGYLAFESEDKTVEWISGEDLGKRLHARGVQVVVLSACKSGIVGGASIFNGVASALARDHIPAVVAMQFSVDIYQAEKLVEFFYWALLNNMPLTRAIAEVRIAFKDSWYRPVLYMRSNAENFQGEVFEANLQIPPPKQLGTREKWIARLGFKRDPFLYIRGEKDPYLHEYFYVEMLNFNNILDRESRAGAVFAFGLPGSGKSSIRQVLTQLYSNDKNLVVVYQDFGQVIDKYRNNKTVQISDHVEQIIRLIVRTLAELVYSKSLPWRDLESKRSSIIRRQLWAYVLEYEDDPLRQATLEILLESDQQPAISLPSDDRERLSRLCRYVTELFEFQLVYILIDPDDFIDPDDTVAWGVLEPLLLALRSIEMSEQRVAFRFFLSHKYRDQARKIPWIDQEWDRRCYTLDWPNGELLKLLQVRLKTCSGGRFVSLGALSEVTDLDEIVIEMSVGRPRQLIGICDKLFNEHCRRRLPEEDGDLLISAQEVNDVVKSYKESSPKSPNEQRLEQWLDEDEGETLEFKSTMRFHLKAGRRDKEMDKEVARTMGGFMNTSGGILIIGVDDDKKVLGLEADFSTFGARQNRDGFEQAFVNITETLFETPVPQNLYESYFIEYDDKLVYVIEVRKSEAAVFNQFDDGTEFYVRKHNTTRKLGPKDIWAYCSQHFRTA